MLPRAVPTEAIVCPTCRAADTSRADPSGVHTCVYCGARYRLSAAQAVPVAAASGKAPTSKGRNLAVIAGLCVLLAAAIGARFALRVSSRPAPTARVFDRDVPLVRNPTTSARPKPDAPPEAPATATFEFQAKATGYQTSFYVLGYVTNTSPYVIERAKVVAVLVDAAGKEVGTAQGYTSAHELAVGEKSTIKILVNAPPPHADIRYEVVARKVSYRREAVSGLRVEAGSPTRAAFGSSWDVNGKVFNEGKDPAKFLRVNILAFDGAGKLIGLHETFAQGANEVVSPGQSARFTALAAFPNTTPARFEFQVDAMAAKN